jgi:hypothetical protein
MASSPHAPDSRQPTSRAGAASRYWTFHTIDASLFLTVAAGLVALAFPLMRRHAWRTRSYLQAHPGDRGGSATKTSVAQGNPHRSSPARRHGGVLQRDRRYTGKA